MKSDIDYRDSSFSISFPLVFIAASMLALDAEA